MGFFEDWEEEQRRRIEEANGNMKPWAEGSEIKGQPTDTAVSVQSIEYWQILQQPEDVNYDEYELTSDSGLTGIETHHYVREDMGIGYGNFLSWLNSMGLEWTEIDISSLWSFDLPFPRYKMRLTSSRSDAYTTFQGSINLINRVLGNDIRFGRSGDIIGTSSFLRFAWIETSGRYGYIIYGRENTYNTHKAIIVLLDYNDTAKNLIGEPIVTKGNIFDEQYGAPNELGGYGGVGSAFNVVSDKISLPAKPTLGVSSTGLLNVYKVNEFTLANFGSFLFSTEPTDDTYYVPTEDVEEMDDITNALAKMVNNLSSRMTFGIKQKANGDLVDYVIDCHILPFNPSVEDNPVYIKVGWKTSEYLGKKITSDYTDVSCGTIEIPFMYNNFLDTHAIVKLFLPFVGYVQLNTQEVIGKSINLTYRFNVIDGSFIAYIRTLIDGDLSIIGAYSGTACVHMPITGINYSNMISGMMQTASGIIGGVAGAMTGNPLALVGGFASAAQGIGNMNNATVQQSNGYNASASFMGNRRPFVVIEYPQQALPANYYHTNGAPLEKTMKLSDLVGYTEVNNIDMTGLYGIDAAERDEIRQLLENGVYL